MISINDVTKRFGQVTAVQSLSLHVEKGEFFGLIGLNGAGKTTTLKMLVGLLFPDEGTITIGGRDFRREPQQIKARLGYIPDQPYIYDKLSGREFLYFVGGLYRMSRPEIDRRMAFLFELFSVEKWADYRAEEYSHGMRQKIVFCSALLHSPELVILDEPLVGLDPQSGKLVKDLMRLMVREQGITIIMSTHTLAVAEALCDRIGIIHLGKLMHLGTVAEVRAGAGDLEEAFLSLLGGSIEARLYDREAASLLELPELPE